MGKYESLLTVDGVTHKAKMSATLEAETDAIITTHIIPWLTEWTTPVATSFGTKDKILYLHDGITEFVWHNYMLDTDTWKEFANDLRTILQYEEVFHGERNKFKSMAVYMPPAYPRPTAFEKLDYLN